MNRFPLVVGLVCLILPIGTHAQNLTTLLRGTPPPSRPGAATYDASNYYPVVYGSGKYPHLQAALTALTAAQDQLGNANPAAKGIYLPRAKQGVLFAIADLKLAIDHNDGVPISSRSTLPELPTGVGNVSSGLEVVLEPKAGLNGPMMDLAQASLNAALDELKYPDPGNSGVFIQRTITDIAFTIDNANAGRNLSAGYPPYQTKAVAAAKSLDYKMIGGLLLGLVILIVFTASVFLHERRKLPN